MQRTDQTTPWWKRRHAQRLTNWRQQFKDTIELDAYADPGEPIMSVDDNVLSIRNAAHNIRLVYLLPLVIGFWVTSISFIYDFGPSSAQVSYANYRVEKKLELEKKGKPFDEQEYFYSEALVGTDGKGSKLKYINAAIKYGLCCLNRWN
jgi:hypothetical protein